MPRVAVSVAMPLIGDPKLFELQPYIVVPQKKVYFSTDSNTYTVPYELATMIGRLYAKQGLPMMNFGTNDMPPDLLIFQRKALWFAAALAFIHGKNKPSAHFALQMKSVLGSEWTTLFPLIYSGYTNSCVAGKGVEDPVVIYRRGFGSIRGEQLGVSLTRRRTLSAHVSDVLDHAAGHLTLEASRLLRKRSVQQLAQILNCFNGIVYSVVADTSGLVKVQAKVVHVLSNEAQGCAYIPTWDLLVKI
jgi:hypothetical protein